MSANENEVYRLLQSDSTQAKKGCIDAPMPLAADEKSPTALIDAPADKTSIENIVEAQHQIVQVKKSLGSIIDTLAQNPSMISRAATYYGELPFWEKIAVGVGLSVPTLLAGIFANIGILLTISGATVITYTATGIILDDHHHCNINIAERLKAGIFNLAEVLQLTIEALENVRKNLSEEVDKFKSENVRLVHNVNDLGDKIDCLSSQLALYIATEKLLRANKDTLEETAERLKQSSEEQTKLIEENQIKLKQATLEYAHSQKQLSEKIKELDDVKASMSQEIEKSKNIAATLQKVVASLSATALSDKTQKEALHVKLGQFITDKETGFDKVAESMNSTEHELDLAKEEFIKTYERHNMLIDRQERQISRLVELEHLMVHQLKPLEGLSVLLNANGLFAPNADARRAVSPLNITRAAEQTLPVAVS